MLKTRTQAVPPPEPPFEEHVRAVAQRLRSALADLLTAVGADPARPQSMARQIGLDKSLSWKLSKVVTEENPFAAMSHLPGRSGLTILLRSLEKAGGTPAAVEQVRAALDEFERLVEVHSGDRDTLEIMLGGLTREGRPQKDEAHRKLSFVGNSATWGVQAKAQISSHLALPSERQGCVDLAVVSGLIGFRRLRHDVPWAVASVRWCNDDGSQRATPINEPVDPAAAGPEGAPLMPEFCSEPPPPLRVVPGPGGVTRYEITEGPLGNTAAATCITGWMVRNTASMYRTDSDRYGEHFVALNTPVEVVFHDLFVHRSLAFALRPALHLYSQLPGGPVYPSGGRDRGLLPLRDGMLDLGSPPYLVTPEVPRYKQMVESVCARLGHGLDEFHAFRLRLRYPPIPALAVFRYELPERP